MEQTKQIVSSFTAIASADLATIKRFVKIGASGLAYCGANEKAIGVLDEKAYDGMAASFYPAGNAVIVEAGAAVAVGAYVTSDADGKAVTAAALSATTTLVTDLGDGAVAVLADAADPTITTTGTVTLAGGAPPVAINGIAMSAASADGDYIKIITM